MANYQPLFDFLDTLLSMPVNDIDNVLSDRQKVNELWTDNIINVSDTFLLMRPVICTYGKRSKNIIQLLIEYYPLVLAQIIVGYIPDKFVYVEIKHGILNKILRICLYSNNCINFYNGITKKNVNYSIIMIDYDRKVYNVYLTSKHSMIISSKSTIKKAKQQISPIKKYLELKKISYTNNFLF